nr:flagellar filament capping protein FliD [Leifsonia psychrotolerans]
MNTTALIASLMQVEAIPKTLLQAKVTGAQSKITDLQALNGKIAALAALAKKVTLPTALQAFTVTSSSPAATGTASSSAAAGSVDIVVSQLAQAQTMVSGPMSAWPDDPATLTFVAQDGTKTQVVAASGSLDDVVRAINSAGAGVSATKVASGVDAGGIPQYRLQMVSSTSGDAAAFTVFRGTATAVDGGTATNLLDDGGAVIRDAQNAEVKLWAGTAAEQTISSATNTFAELLPGVAVTVTAVSAGPVSLMVGRNAEASTATVKELTDALSAIFGTITAKSLTTQKTEADGTVVTALGTFSSNSTIKSIKQSIVSAVGQPIDGFSPSEVGISFSADGSLVFDAEKFAAALAANPAKAEGMIATIAGRVETAAASISDKYQGLLTNQITSQESLVKTMNKQVDSWDRRLAARESTLKRTYAALEVALGKMNSQSSYLASQISGLPSWNSSNK